MTEGLILNSCPIFVRNCNLKLMEEMCWTLKPGVSYSILMIVCFRLFILLGSRDLKSFMNSHKQLLTEATLDWGAHSTPPPCCYHTYLHDNYKIVQHGIHRRLSLLGCKAIFKHITTIIWNNTLWYNLMIIIYWLGNKKVPRGGPNRNLHQAWDSQGWWWNVQMGIIFERQIIQQS